MEFHGNKLKTKIFVISCAEHGRPNKEHWYRKMHKMLDQIGIELSTETECDQVIKQISFSDFYGYASLLFILMPNSKCSLANLPVMVDKLYESISKNATLRHVTKIVMTYVDIGFNNISGKTCFPGSKHSNFIYQSENQLFSKMEPDTSAAFDIKPGQNMISPLAFNPATRHQFEESIRHQYMEILKPISQMKIPTIDNLIVMHNIQLGSVRQNYHPIIVQFFRRVLKSAGLKSMQELARSTLENSKNKFIMAEMQYFQTTCSGGCYLFNINPALVIIFNHINFTELQVRESSREDLKSLKKLFTAKKIPHLVIEDGRAEDVKLTMAKVQQTKLVGLKELFVIVMSHERENDIIYSKTDTYNLNEDIVAPLLANLSLKNVRKIVILNACRGNTDHRDVDILEYEPTDSTDQEETLVKMFSAVKGCVSYRDPKGSFFIQKFCEVFQEVYNECPMNEIAVEIERRLHEYWDEYQGPASEYCAKPGTVHNIKMEFKNRTEYEDLLMEMHKFAIENAPTETVPVSK